VSYSGGSSSGESLTDYTLPSASVAVNYQYSEVLTPFVQASFSRYQPDDNEPTQDYMSVVSGAEWNVSDRFNLKFSVGVNQVNSTNKDTSMQGAVSLNYLTERTTTAASLSHAMTPTGDGGFRETDRLQVGIVRELTNRSAVGSDISITQSEELSNLDGNQVSNSDSSQIFSDDYYALSLFYRYEILPKWNMRLYAQYDEQKSEGEETANRNLLGITVTYTNPNF
jgi:predicted porin